MLVLSESEKGRARREGGRKREEGGREEGGREREEELVAEKWGSDVCMLKVLPLERGKE